MDIKSLARDVSGAIMAIGFMSCYIPQIARIIKTRSSADISPLMIIFGLIGYIFGMIYMFLNVFGLWWFFNYTSGIVTSLVLFYYWFKHRND
jgi:uncharacterized protein with PQ loop repeat